MLPQGRFSKSTAKKKAKSRFRKNTSNYLYKEKKKINRDIRKLNNDIDK